MNGISFTKIINLFYKIQMNVVQLAFRETKLMHVFLFFLKAGWIMCKINELYKMFHWDLRRYSFENGCISCFHSTWK